MKKKMLYKGGEELIKFQYNELNSLVHELALLQKHLSQEERKFRKKYYKNLNKIDDILDKVNEIFYDHIQSLKRREN